MIGLLAPDRPRTPGPLRHPLDDAGTCLGRPCDEDCLQTGERVGAFRRGRRWVRSGLALTGGAALVAAAAAVPGGRRDQRAARALRRASRWLLAALEVEVRVRGRPAPGAGLVVGNHVSFLDILVLAAVEPMSMVAKAEVAGWPVVGPISRAVGGIFVDRGSLRALPATVADMTAALRSGRKVQVFPEGTTRCGRNPGEFSRAAFQAAIDAARCVLPCTIAYRCRGEKTTAAAFLGQESVVDCLRRVIACPQLSVDLHFLPPVGAVPRTGHRATDRRSLARRVQSIVEADLARPAEPAVADVVRAAVVRARPARADQVRIGPVRTGQVRVGQRSGAA